MSIKNVKNKTSRSGFDLSRRVCFTAKVGELLPIWWRNVVPGDHFEIDLESVMRTAPVSTAAQARLRGYFDFFFVPMQQLWQFFNTTITQMNDNVQYASGPNKSDNKPLSGYLPHTTYNILSSFIEAVSTSENYSKNLFGFDRSFCCTKLKDYLFLRPGKVGFKNRPFSLLPFAAYQKIYADFFRYTQWESPNSSTWNLNYIQDASQPFEIPTDGDYLKNNTMFDLRYCNYQKDFFHGVLPNPQFGETSSVPLNFSLADTTFGYAFSGSNAAPESSGNVGNVWSMSTDGSESGPNTDDYLSRGTGLTLSNAYKYLKLTSADGGRVGMTGNLSILVLRQYEMFQKWKEVSLAAEEDYKQQIEAHWGISVSDYLSGMVRYLGGIDENIRINEVVNTNLVQGDSTQPADIAGKGYSDAKGSIVFESKGEYGIIMCVYHALPLLDYVTTFCEPEFSLIKATDYPIPELDSIGMDVVPSYFLSSRGTSPLPDFLGYGTRYLMFKTSFDLAVGAFTTTLKNWILPYSDSDLVISSDALTPDDNPNVTGEIRYQFFKVNPHITDSIFATSADDSFDTDPLWYWTYVRCRASRLFDYNGLPY